jgi:proline racemase
MDNMGGLLKLYFIDADDFVSLEEDGEELYDLTLDNGATIHEISFTEDTGKISETEETTDNGIAYNFEAVCRIPACGPGNSDPLGDLRDKKLLILGEDSNNNFWLAGSPGSYFSIALSSTTGQAPQEPNARQLRISATLAEGAVFINSPF